MTILSKAPSIPPTDSWSFQVTYCKSTVLNSLASDLFGRKRETGGGEGWKKEVHRAGESEIKTERGRQREGDWGAERVRGRGRETERGGERGTGGVERQRDRQTDRQTETDRDRDTEREGERERERESDHLVQSSFNITHRLLVLPGNILQIKQSSTLISLVGRERERQKEGRGGRGKT